MFCSLVLTVYSAAVQISLCRNTDAEQEKVVETVKQEIDLMAKFNHPNIVRILGATQHLSHFFVFVEWMPGVMNVLIIVIITITTTTTISNTT